MSMITQGQTVRLSVMSTGRSRQCSCSARAQNQMGLGCSAATSVAVSVTHSVTQSAPCHSPAGRQEQRCSGADPDRVERCAPPRKQLLACIAIASLFAGSSSKPGGSACHRLVHGCSPDPSAPAVPHARLVSPRGLPVQQDQDDGPREAGRGHWPGALMALA
jgi:hypothetical protein